MLSLILQVFCLTPDKLYSVLLCAAKCWDTLEVLWLQNYYFKIFLICMCTVFFFQLLFTLHDLCSSDLAQVVLKSKFSEECLLVSCRSPARQIANQEACKR